MSTKNIIKKLIPIGKKKQIEDVLKRIEDELISKDKLLKSKKEFIAKLKIEDPSLHAQMKNAYKIRLEQLTKRKDKLQKMKTKLVYYLASVTTIIGAGTTFGIKKIKDKR